MQQLQPLESQIKEGLRAIAEPIGGSDSIDKEADMETNISFENVEAYIKENLPELYFARVDPKAVEFEQRFELLCFYCAHYNVKWTCPPKIPKVDYKKVFSEYDQALLLSNLFSVQEDPMKARTESSVKLHRALLDIEGFLLKNGNPVRLSFIGGSCKLCKNDCAKDKCRNPYEARIPLEATTVNVIKLAEQCGIEVKFPVEETIRRIGLILW